MRGRQGAEESNLILRIWNPLGHHGLHPVALRSGNDPLSPLGTNVKTPPVARLQIRFAALRCGSSTYPTGTPRRRALVCSRLFGGLGPGF